MAHIFAKIAMFVPALATAAGCGAVSASGDDRALSLQVTETADTVEIEVVADSAVTQQIAFTAELSGASNSRHKSDTSIAAGKRQVLSRMKISASDSWCAKVDVTEGTGAKYTLTSGDCGIL